MSFFNFAVLNWKKNKRIWKLHLKTFRLSSGRDLSFEVGLRNSSVSTGKQRMKRQRPWR